MEETAVYPSPSSFTQPRGAHLSLTTSADRYRVDAYQKVTDTDRAQHGQYFTPPSIARMMAGFFQDPPAEVNLLDPGAGVGALTAAAVEEMLTHPQHPKQIKVTAYEQEPKFYPYLARTLKNCQALCHNQDVAFSYTIETRDFIDAASAMLRPRLFDRLPNRFNRAILNPPYKKIHSKSTHRRLLRQAGIKTVNLYTAFLALTINILESGGELVAITPRSFCNGPYYKSFRQLFNAQMAFKRIHLFESRDQAFAEDDVLQENIIFHAIKEGDRTSVTVTSSASAEEANGAKRRVAYRRVLNPDDPHLFIHITAGDLDQNVADRIERFPCTLVDLGLDVSTGRVVDFRAKAHLRQNPSDETVPLIYPHHMKNGWIEWPDPTANKPNAFVDNPQTARWLLPAGNYVIVRRFSSKEEKRRINAAVYDPSRVRDTAVAFENHLNVFHAFNRGLPPQLARGLAIFLNSTLLDVYFRQFNGHTQVNATDLRTLLYPQRETLIRWGTQYTDQFPNQQTINSLVESELQTMSDLETPDPIAAKKRVAEAIDILESLGLPRAQQNERSAMTLLALLGTTPSTDWSQATAPLMGITPIMDFIRIHYGVDYAPNTRETIRRQTVHQFVQATIVVENPDQPDRPKNSPNWCYQIEPTVLELLRTYNTDRWEIELNAYLDKVITLQEKYARQRELHQIPVRVRPGFTIDLSPGKHSQLIKQVIEEFAPRFVPGGQLIYVGDTAEKWGYFDETLLTSMGITVDEHGKMPDVIIYYGEKDWLLLIEAVTSHGPVNPKRRIELQDLFAPALEKIVYVTAFPTMSDMSRHLSNIAWATEVWIAEKPTHLIHFDGVRFLGPYDEKAIDQTTDHSVSGGG